MRISSCIASLMLLGSLATPVLAGSLTIEGVGEVSATPDSALITSGVTTQAETAREALDDNSAAMEELVKALSDAGIERRDIQTSSFSVSPNYVYSDQRDTSGYSLPPRITGYQVSNQVTVRVRDIENLGTILDRAVAVGSNTINAISFLVDDPTELYDEARRRAFADAHRKAGLYAELAGSQLGEIEAISEGSLYAPPQPMMRDAFAGVAQSAVPIEAGEMSFSISVSVRWDLED